MMPAPLLPNEDASIRLLLEQHGIRNPQLTPLPRDASKRYYYRVEGERFLIMVADATQKPEQFKRVSEILIGLGLKAPRVHAEQDDFYLIDNFGESTYRQAMTNTNRSMLYEKATDVLIHIAQHIQTQGEGIPAYTRETILSELMLFLEWYGDASPNLSSSDLIRGSASDRDPRVKPEGDRGGASMTEFIQLWQQYLSQISGPQTLILRDYHIDNLFYFPEERGLKQIGLIDFQDAVFGPAPVDLISLTEDARVDVPHSIREHVTQRFMDTFPVEQHEALIRTAKIIDLARQLRILGVFFRLAKRDGRRHYLDYVPRLHGYVKQHLKDPFFKDFSQWCRTHDLFQD